MIVGLTGGIGAGKTTALAIFKEAGLTCFDADPILLDLYKPGSKVFQEILSLTGDKVLTNGSIDWDKLRPINLPTSINTLVLKSIWDIVLQGSQIGKPTIFASARILEEAFPVNRVCTVACPQAMQITRATQRGVETHILAQIIKRQLSLDERLKKSSEVIVNEGSLAKLRETVLDLATFYTTLAQDTKPPLNHIL